MVCYVCVLDNSETHAKRWATESGFEDLEFVFESPAEETEEQDQYIFKCKDNDTFKKFHDDGEMLSHHFMDVECEDGQIAFL